MYRTTIIYRLYSQSTQQIVHFIHDERPTRVVELEVLRDDEREALKVTRYYQAR